MKKIINACLEAGKSREEGTASPSHAKQRVSKEWEGIETIQEPAWVRRVERRACIANETTNPRRSRRVNGGEVNQEHANIR